MVTGVKKTYRGMGIATKFILLTVSLIIATSTIIAVYFVQRESKKSYQDLLTHGTTLATTMAQNCEYAIYTQDKTSMKQSLVGFETQQDILYATLLSDTKENLHHKTMISAFPSNPINIQHSKLLGSNGPFHADIEITSSGRTFNILDIIVPVLSHTLDNTSDLFLADNKTDKAQIIGYLQIGLSKENYHSEITNFIYTTIIFTILLMAVGIFCTFLVTHRITSPLKKLNRAIDDFSRGSYDMKVDVRGNDEVAKLATTFNNLGERIQEYHATLEKQNQNLEESNAKLVGEMEYRKKIEEELVKSKKLESLGLLAGGIAHDFNNLLTAILGNISIASNSMNKNDELYEVLGNAEHAAQRAKDLTYRLLTFSKGGMPVREPGSITHLTKETAEFATKGSKVKCIFNCPHNLWLVNFDGGQISQVINNIVINGVQAMPEGGTISIDYTNTNLGSNNALNLKEGKYVKIAITDQGVGISPEDLSKIFDPFYSTKEGGSGLGLSNCYSIIKNHHGTIQIESTEGIGSTFLLFLPAHEGKKIQEPEKTTELIHGQGKILVMDDEKMVQEVVGRMLVKLGYEVEFAKDGDEAITMYSKAQEANNSYDAVIMDLTIPGGMGGKDAIQKLLEVDACIKAIVSSGYSNDPVMAEYEKYGFRGIISKPYLLHELSQTVHEVLAAD